jgi:hypothetical protein
MQEKPLKNLEDSHLSEEERLSENPLKPPSLSPNRERKTFTFYREENPTFSTFDNILSKRQHIQKKFHKKNRRKFSVV